MVNREGFCPALYRSCLRAGAGRAVCQRRASAPLPGCSPGPPRPVRGLCVPGLRERGQGPPFSSGLLLKLIASSPFFFQVTVVSTDPLGFTPRSTSSSQASEALGPVLVSEGEEAQPSCLGTVVYQSQHQLTTEGLG